MGDIYGGRNFHYERATNDVTFIPSGSDVFVRRAEQNRVYHVHVTGPHGRGHLVRQHLVGTPWMPATGLLRFETGASYACIWIPAVRTSLPDARDVANALAAMPVEEHWQPRPTDIRDGQVIARRYRPGASAYGRVIAIEWPQIFQWEGNHTEGEVPGAHSGVTIAAGFDLHEKTTEALRQTHAFSRQEIEDLAPFIQHGITPGPVGDAARERLDAWRQAHGRRPLISDQTAERLNQQQSVARGRLAAVLYSQASSVLFADIPPAAQTVVASELYRCGSPSGCLRMWRAAVRQDWAGVVEALRAQARLLVAQNPPHTGVANRLLREAAYLQTRLHPTPLAPADSAH